MAYLMGDSLSCDCMDPMVSANTLKGLMWGKEDWKGMGGGVDRRWDVAVKAQGQQQSENENKNKRVYRFRREGKAHRAPLVNAMRGF
jgi:hypothetical protein